MRIYLILILFLLFGCIEPAGDDRLRIVNHTNYELAYSYNTDIIPRYPSVIDAGIYFDHPVKINDTVKVFEYDHKPWHWFFEKSKNKKINLFIYNLDSLKVYRNIDTLIKRKIYRKFEYSEQEINKLNWIVTIEN